MKYSKLGASLVGIYIIASAGLWIYAALCKELYCGLVILISIFPWIFLFESIIDDSVFGYFLSVSLNILLVYGIGVCLSKLKNLFQSQNTSM